jgi:hypothetical protein
MSKVIDAAEVAKHKTKDSCWVILYGNVYDVRTSTSASVLSSLTTMVRSHHSSPVTPAAARSSSLSPAKMPQKTTTPSTHPVRSKTTSPQKQT